MSNVSNMCVFFEKEIVYRIKLTPLLNFLKVTPTFDIRFKIFVSNQPKKDVTCTLHKFTLVFTELGGVED